MTDDAAFKLYELADRIVAIGRHFRPPPDLQPGPCSPVEITVMRHINHNPGTTPRAAAEATLLPSSNLSRTLRTLEEKGLVRREADVRDTRGIRLYPTPLAAENVVRLRSAWSQALAGALPDEQVIDVVNAALRRVEEELVTRRGATERQEF